MSQRALQITRYFFGYPLWQDDQVVVLVDPVHKWLLIRQLFPTLAWYFHRPMLIGC
jgi:hypothetical protein